MEVVQTSVWPTIVANELEDFSFAEKDVAENAGFPLAG